MSVGFIKHQKKEEIDLSLSLHCERTEFTSALPWSQDAVFPLWKAHKGWNWIDWGDLFGENHHSG